MAEGPPFYFIHVPKSGGTSLRKALIDAYGDRLCPVYRATDAQAAGTGKDNFLDPTTLRGKVTDLPYLARHQVYFGHYRFGIHDHLSRPGVYLSLIRAPLERLVSEIKHVARHAQSKFHPMLAGGLGLQEIVESHKGWHFDNLTTRMFGGRVGPRYAERVHFERAVRNVTEHFAFVGHQASFDASLAALFGILRHNLTLADYRLNVAPREQDFDLSRYAPPDYVDRLLKWDLLLEQFILDRFWGGGRVPQAAHSRALSEVDA